MILVVSLTPEQLKRRAANRSYYVANRERLIAAARRYRAIYRERHNAASRRFLKAVV